MVGDTVLGRYSAPLQCIADTKLSSIAALSTLTTYFRVSCAVEQHEKQDRGGIVYRQRRWPALAELSHRFGNQFGACGECSYCLSIIIGACVMRSLATCDLCFPILIFCVLLLGFSQAGVPGHICWEHRTYFQLLAFHHNFYFLLRSCPRRWSWWGCSIVRGLCTATSCSNHHGQSWPRM